MDDKSVAKVAELCGRVLQQNWREGDENGRHYGFTAPSPSHYPWQWYWDSGFHAIVWRRIDPARSRLELETLLDGSRDGFIGHTSFLGRPLDMERATRYNVATRHEHDPATPAGMGLVDRSRRPHHRTAHL